MLEALDRTDPVPGLADDRRRWYRYHQLFADVLHARLLDEQPGQVPDLHRRASAWYQQNGEPSEAISHALAAEDFERRAADLVELAIPAMRMTRQEATLRLAQDASRRGGPRQARAQRWVCRGVAGRRRARGCRGTAARRRTVPRRNDRCRRRISAPSAEMAVDDEEFRRLPAGIELYRSALAMARGDVPGTVRHARRALDLSPEQDHLCWRFGSGHVGARVLDERGSRGRALGVCRMRGGTTAGRAHCRYLRLRDRAGGHPACARSSSRGDADLRAGIAART